MTTRTTTAEPELFGKLKALWEQWNADMLVRDSVGWCALSLCVSPTLC
jgi:hypothetical protein